MPGTTPPPAEILVCLTCRRGAEAPEDVARPGLRLYRALRAAGPVPGLRVRPVECLSNCSRGCTIALRGEGRWTYVYGHLDETADVATILAGAELYRDTPDGLVPWRARPEHFRKNCIARLPPADCAAEEPAHD